MGLPKFSPNLLTTEILHQLIVLYISGGAGLLPSTVSSSNMCVFNFSYHPGNEKKATFKTGHLTITSSCSRKDIHGYTNMEIHHQLNLTIIYNHQISITPWKIDMEHEHHLLEKGNHLWNLHLWVCRIIYGGVTYQQQASIKCQLITIFVRFL